MTSNFGTAKTASTIIAQMMTPMATTSSQEIPGYLVTFMTAVIPMIGDISIILSISWISC